jgi:hypothetical protein
MATGFDPKLGSSSGLETRIGNMCRNWKSEISFIDIKNVYKIYK